MANVPRRRYTTGMSGLVPAPSNRFTPYKELGTSGVAVFGGRPMTREKDVRVSGPQKWVTYSDILANTSIVAAGVRFFLNMVAHAKWSVEPAESDEKGTPVAGGEDAAKLVDKIINGMETPWRRVMRRAAMYRFHGFGIQEWTAIRREDDGKVGLVDIESRPAHTIDRWEVDEQGTVKGAWQLSPQTMEFIYLPRGKIMYMVEDSLTDSPEGLGLFRHVVAPALRLERYLTLEGFGFDRDLRGTPIGRIPYRAISQWVADGSMKSEDAATIISSIENFVKLQAKGEDTSITLDSSPYVVETEGGKSISGVMQYGLELLQGQSPDFVSMANAIQRLNMEMARVIGVEHLLLGSDSGSRALSEDKSRNFYLTVNGTLDEITDAANKDVVAPICDLNGIKKELRPKVKHSDVSFRAVLEYTAALSQLATAGAVLAPDDPAINDVRDMLGISKAPEPSPEMIDAFRKPNMGILDEQGNPIPKPLPVDADGNPVQKKPPFGKKPNGEKPAFGKPAKKPVSGSGVEEDDEGKLKAPIKKRKKNGVRPNA